MSNLLMNLLGILLGLKCGMVRDCMAQISCLLVYVYLAQLTLVGVWSMALVLWQCIEYHSKAQHIAHARNLRTPHS